MCVGGAGRVCIRVCLRSWQTQPRHRRALRTPCHPGCRLRQPLLPSPAPRTGGDPCCSIAIFAARHERRPPQATRCLRSAAAGCLRAARSRCGRRSASCCRWTGRHRSVQGGRVACNHTLGHCCSMQGKCCSSSCPLHRNAQCMSRRPVRDAQAASSSCAMPCLPRAVLCACVHTCSHHDRCTAHTSTRSPTRDLRLRWIPPMRPWRSASSRSTQRVQGWAARACACGCVSAHVYSMFPPGVVGSVHVLWVGVIEWEH